MEETICADIVWKASCRFYYVPHKCKLQQRQLWFEGFVKIENELSIYADIWRYKQVDCGGDTRTQAFLADAFKWN